MLKIQGASFLHEKGKRDNNEDNLSFDIDEGIFVLCDGVGGSEKGEIASDVAVNTFIQNSSSVKSSSDFKEILLTSESKLNDHVRENPESVGLATTLTVSKFIDQRLLIGWVGDSRIYHFRNGQILYQTRDHSWVNEAIKSGLVTEEEAVNHPKRNMILRAVQSGKPAEMDTDEITDLRAGDFIFHCSDGILESWNDIELQSLFSSSNNSDELIKQMKEKCSVHSRDNFSAIIFKIEESAEGDFSEKKIVSNKKKASSVKWLVLFILLSGMAFCILYFKFDCFKQTTETVGEVNADATKTSFEDLIKFFNKK
jgi:protein phosphatase